MLDYKEKWILVGDNLPEDGEKVIISTFDKQVLVATFRNEYHRYGNDEVVEQVWYESVKGKLFTNNENVSEVLAWRPLIKAYEK